MKKFCRFAYIIKTLEKMRYVKLTEEQAKKMNSKKIGLTSGKRDKETGIRPNIKFCSSLDFVKAFGYDVKREFIEI